MNQFDVVVIDYGIGNLLSVRRGLEHCGASVEVSSDPDVIYAAPRVLLPGVGAFANAMDELQRLQLVEVVQTVAARGTPLLGICLGMQLLLDQSEEFGRTAGLGLIPGEVVPINAKRPDGMPLKVPHIGWSELYPEQDGTGWSGTLMQDVKPGDAVYFVHSFMARTLAPSHRLAQCRYGDLAVSAVISRDNIHGCQFHPEKSGETGLKILRSFLSL
ncbi:imidazole glycerol phosphate synthase subunit HisH [Herbaspirillum seropedicae]|uniref:imidazole glycerol phosphate synthase subunit HisH n=1 Tax=Herbaspirillum seropedicae TaxID=964 RepID=UPI003F8D307F